MLETIRNLHIGCCTDEGKPSTAVGFGVTLAQRSGAHVTFQVVSTRLAAPQSFLSDVGAVLVAEENQRRVAAARSFAETCQKEAAAAGLPSTSLPVHLSFGDAVAAFARQSRLHDFSILDARPDALCLERALLEEVLFNCGRPVLLVPEGSHEFSVDHVMVAWDGSTEAARALNDALPLLKAAGSVDLVSITEDGKDGTLPGAEIAPHLARHGVRAILIDLEGSGRDIEKMLRNQSHAHRTKLIVMGAYAHSWWRELVLGGVTQSFLKNPPAPLFLSR